MKSPWLTAVAAALALSAGSGAGPAAQARQTPAPPSFRSGVDVVSLNVTVTDGGSRYVTDLDKQDFVVYEDGVQQDLVYFNRASLPIALSLLLDTSASMEEKIGTAQEAAIGFAQRLRPQDRASVIDFDSRVEVLQSFTNDVPALEAAIRQTAAGGSTSLYNAIYISLKDLKRMRATSETDVRRQAIVVLSDGEDTSSLMTFEEVLDLAKRSETAIYTIGLRSKEPVKQHGYREAEFVLRSLAQETGGRAFFATEVGELSGIYGQIAEELSSQYVLGYTSKNPKRDGVWRRIVVRTSRSDLVARTKQGYYAAGPRS